MLELSHFEGDIFFIQTEKKRSDLRYGVVRVQKIHLVALLETIKITGHGRPIPLHLQENLDMELMPRLQEIKKYIEDDESVPKKFGIEISNENQSDILYKLNIPRVKNILKDRGYFPLELIDLIAFIQLFDYSTE